MNKKESGEENNDKASDKKNGFFVELTEEEFKKRKAQIDKFNKKELSAGAENVEGLTGEALLNISTRTK